MLKGVRLSDGTYATGSFTYDFTTQQSVSGFVSVKSTYFDGSVNAPISVTGDLIVMTNYYGGENVLQLTLNGPLTPTSNATVMPGKVASYYKTVDVVGLASTLPVKAGSVVAIPTTGASAIGPGGDNGWFVGPAKVTITTVAGAFPIAKVMYAIGDDSYQHYAGPFTVRSQGMNTIGFYAVDSHGHSSGLQTLSVDVDSTPPVTTFSQAANSVVTLTATDNASGVAATYYSIDGGAPQTGGYGINPYPSGTHTISFWSVDIAGNVEAPQTQSFTDTYVTYPTYPGPPYIVSTVAGGAVIGWNPSYDQSGIQTYIVYRLTGHSGRGGGVTWTEMGASSTNQITLPSADSGELFVEAVDNAGLATVGAPATLSF